VVAVYDGAVAALADDPYRHVELLLRVGQIHEVQRADADAAISRYRAVLEVDAGNASALRALDRLYEALEQWPQVAEVLRRELTLSDLSPDDAVSLRYRLGQVLERQLGDAAGALAVYREIIDVQADHAETVAALEAMFARGVLRGEVAAALVFLQLFDSTGNAYWSSDKKAKVVTTANNAGGGHMSGLLLLNLT
jgi:tetratricopeptide (TPR) repeat protein